MKTGFISLSCSKNLVDSERMMGVINDGGHKLVHNADEAETIIINTCGFVSPAREEVIQAILQMAEYKKHRCRKLIVVGCLAQRYREQLEQNIPETDTVINIREYSHLHELLPRLLDGYDLVGYDKCERKVSSKPWTAYLRIVEGYSNRCTYCVISLIHGDNMSFPIEQLVEEAKQLAQRGVRELVVVAQDTTKHDVDLYDRRALLDPPQQLHGIGDFHWIRILCMCPDEIDTRLIEGTTKLPKMLPYFDIPVQHASNRMLQLMDRRGSGEDIAALVKKIQETFSYPILCITLIVGLPTEEEADSSELMQFIEDIYWDRTEAFPYSPEEDTPAYSVDGAVDEDVEEARLAQLMGHQEEISLENQRRMVGEIIEVLVEDQEGLTGVYRGRGVSLTPDEVGDIVMFKSERFIKFGSFVKVRITEVPPHDFKDVEVC